MERVDGFHVARRDSLDREKRLAICRDSTLGRTMTGTTRTTGDGRADGCGGRCGGAGAAGRQREGAAWLHALTAPS